MKVIIYYRWNRQFLHLKINQKLGEYLCSIGAGEVRHMTNLKVGRVTHYYDKIGVAVMELDGNLASGERIKFVRGGEDMFEQAVDSMQVEHKKVDSAKKGDIVGLKTDQEVKEGAEVYKVG